MTGQEFLRELEQELTTCSYSQREEVMTYFKEYLAEIEDDPAAMADLGSPKELAKDLQAQLKEQDILETKLELARLEADHSQFSRLVVDLKTIDLEVHGTYCQELELELSDQLRERLEIIEDSGQLQIKEKQKPTFNWLTLIRGISQQDKLRIKLPRSSQLASVKLRSLSGDMELTQVQVDQLDCKLTNGDLSLDKIESKSAKIKLTNGDLDLVNTKFERLSAELMNGDLTIEDSQWQKAKLEDLNGDITLEQVLCQEVKIELLRGDLEVTGTSWQETFEVDLSCGDANFDLESEFKEKLSFKLSTSFGDCSVGDAPYSGSSSRLSYQAPVVGPRLEVRNQFGDICLD